MANPQENEKDTKALSVLRRDPASGRWSIVPKKPLADKNQARKETAEEAKSRKSKTRYKESESYIIDRERLEFDQDSCVWSKQFCGGKRQEKEAVFGLRWSETGGSIEITYDNWHDADWEVIVVKSDYAQVVSNKEHVLLGADPFVSEAGYGIHELIIEDSTEDHLPLGVMNEKRTQLILLAMLYRLEGEVKGFPTLDETKVGKSLKQLPGIRHVSFFHNHRREAGGSQEHPHSQIIGSPIVPSEVSAELEYVLKRHDQPPRRCVYCEIIEAEQAIRDRADDGDASRKTDDPEGDSKSSFASHIEPASRILFETKHFLVVQPFCSTYPFETWILPKRHSPSFGDIDTAPEPEQGIRRKSELEELAYLINAVVGRLYACLDDPGYNLIVKSQPITKSDEITKYSYYHWHIRIEPRGITTPAGYELSTNVFSCPTPPEETTEFLQKWGILGKADPFRIGTIEWYTKVVALNNFRNCISDINDFDKWLKEICTGKDEKKTHDKKDLSWDANRILGKTMNIERSLEIIWNLFKEKCDNVFLNSNGDLKKIYDRMFDLLKTYSDKDSCQDLLKKWDKEGLNTLVFKISEVFDWAAVCIARTPIKLQNILKIIDGHSANLKAYAGAARLISELSEKRPDLFLTQQTPPHEARQRQKPTEKAGDEDGPHYRRCPGTGRWVLIPGKARRRPLEKLQEAQEKKQIQWNKYLPKDSYDECDLCKQLDKNNPDENKVDKNKLVGGFHEQEFIGTNDFKKVRNNSIVVIENRKPLLHYTKGKSNSLFISGIGPFEEMEGRGKCEVIVFPDRADPRHHYNQVITQSNIKNALIAVVNRIHSIKEMDSGKIGSSLIRHISIFCNHRTEAGATMSHYIWQLIASPIVPTGIERELDHSRQYFKNYSGRCCICDMVSAEISNADKNEKDQRILLGQKEEEKKAFVALTPFASRSPFEVWILPKEHSYSIENTLVKEEHLNDKYFKENPFNINHFREEQLNELSEIIRQILNAINDILSDPGYSMIIQIAPFELYKGGESYGYYHWKIVLEPQKLAIPAGYEYLTGIWSNVMAPEKAAEILRNTLKSPVKKKIRDAS